MGSFLNALTKIVAQFLNSKEKEVNKMTKKIIAIGILFAVAICFSAVANAAVVDKTISVTASASITGATSLSADVAALTFGTTNADALPTAPTSKKITLTYTSNYNPWKIAVYTKNDMLPKKSVDPLNGIYAKGGLVAGAPGAYNIVPLKWITRAPASEVPDVATINFQTSYNFIKDMNDEDDPATTGDDGDESWATALAGGYPNIAWGPVVGGGGVCVDPTNIAAGENQYRGEAINGSVAVYVVGLFATGGVTPAVPAAAGEYSGTIYFDLYHP